MKLSPLTKENCEEARQWRNIDIAAYRTPLLLTEEMQEDFYRDVICNRNAPHRYWTLLNNHQFVGMGGLTNIQWENGLAEISLVVKGVFQNEGFGVKGVDLLLDQAFNYLNLKTVCGECYRNTKAVDFWQLIIKKYAGFATNLLNRKYWNGKYYDSLYFSIEKDEFRKIHSPIQPA